MVDGEWGMENGFYPKLLNSNLKAPTK